MFDVILSLPISLTHLIASSGEGSVDDTPYSPTSHVDSREHLQKTVESFLSIVPPDLCSAAYEESGDLGYNTYLLEAQARVSIHAHCTVICDGFCSFLGFNNTVLSLQPRPLTSNYRV